MHMRKERQIIRAEEDERAWRQRAMVRVNAAAVSWDAERKRWLIRLVVGEEVIKRAVPNATRDADDEVLRSLAVETAKDEGYDLNALCVTVTR